MIYWFLTWGYNTSKAWASLPITLVIETSTFRRRVISLTLIFNLKLSFHHDKSLPITLTYLQRYELFFKLIAFWTNFFFFLCLRSQTHLYNSKIGTTSKSISKSCKMIIFLVHKCHSSIAQVHLTMVQERLSVDKQSLWSLRLWVIFRLSNVENLELINKITIFAHENGTQRKLGKRI